MALKPHDSEAVPAAEQFHTTHWSVVLMAGKSQERQAGAALENLCRTYWSPIYAYVRRQGHRPQDAQDLTQEFFARLLEKSSTNWLLRSGGGSGPSSLNHSNIFW